MTPIYKLLKGDGSGSSMNQVFSTEEDAIKAATNMMKSNGGNFYILKAVAVMRSCPEVERLVG